jgi:hypothetical protein
MRIRPLDTSAEADRIQLEIIKRMSPEERLQRGFNMSALSNHLQESGIRARHPEYTDEEVRLARIRLNLGDELFQRVYPKFSSVRP